LSFAYVPILINEISHQRTGVDFIAQREGWRPSCSFSLWDSQKIGLMELSVTNLLLSHGHTLTILPAMSTRSLEQGSHASRERNLVAF